MRSCSDGWRARRCVTSSVVKSAERTVYNVRYRRPVSLSDTNWLCKTQLREERLWAIETICCDLNILLYVEDRIDDIYCCAIRCRIRIDFSSKSRRSSERMARGQRCAGSEEIVTKTSTSNGYFEPVTVPDYGELNCFIQTSLFCLWCMYITILSK